MIPRHKLAISVEINCLKTKLALQHKVIIRCNNPHINNHLPQIFLILYVINNNQILSQLIYTHNQRSPYHLVI